MVVIQARVLLLVSMWAVKSESIRPSDHGLAYEKDPHPVSPAMAAFFSGQPGAELPEALNTTEPTWAAHFSPPSETSSRTGRRLTAVLLGTGIACGLVGVSLVAIAAVVYFARNRQAKPMGLPSPSVGLVRWGKSREVRLGS